MPERGPAESAHGDAVETLRGRVAALEEERNLLVEALTRSEENFRSAFGSSPAGMWLSRVSDGRIVDMNREFLRILGFARAEVIGRTSTELGLWAEDGRRDALIAELRAGGVVTPRETRMRRRDGSVATVLFTAVPVTVGEVPHAVTSVTDISRLKETEIALREAERRWRSLMEQAPAVITIVEPDGTVRSLNRSVSGRSVAELIGKRIFDFLPPEMRSLSRDRLAEAVATARPVRFELAVEGRDGRPVWVENRLAPVAADGAVTAVISVVTDITARVEAEAALRESEQRFRDIVRSMADWVWETDERGRFSYVSEQVEQSLGISPGDLLGKSPAAILDPPEHRRWEELLSDLRSNPRDFEFEAWHRRADTTRVFLAASAVPRLTGEGRLLGYRGVVRDLTERKRAEEERLRMEAEVQQARRVESLGVLAGGVAHDFNNLLTAVLGNAELALAELPPASGVRPLVEQIQTAALHAAELTRQMLTFAGRGSTEMGLVDISKTVAAMQPLLAAAVSKNAALDLELAAGLPAVEADPAQLRQVVMNLVINAAESMGEAEGRITVRTATGDRSAAPADVSLGGIAPGSRTVLLEVSDTGCGVTPDALPKIFDPFFTSKFTGRGLGLAAVQGIVLRHKGAVEVRTRPGEGSVFSILLPAAGPAPAPAEIRPERTEAWGGGRTVLLVDDEAPVRATAERMLRALGFRVACAADGEETVRALTAPGAGIDAVLLDLTLPGRDGRDILRELRGIRPGLPVVLCSGYDVLERTGLFAELNCNGFLQKPFRLGSLSRALRQALGEPPP